MTLVPVRWPPSPQGFSVERPLTIVHEQTKKTDHDHESSSRDRARERAESTELRAAPRSKLHTSRPNEQPCAPSIAFASRLAWSPRSGACRTPQQQHDRRRRAPNDDDDEEGNGAHTKKKLLFPSAAAAWLDLDAARRSVWVHAHKHLQ